MILVKAPLRLSFFGGGSDIPRHYHTYGGATLSATFDKFVYAAIMHTPQPHIKVSYSTTEYAETLDDVNHDIVREALRWHNVRNNIEITSFADIPTVGTGLGASSAFNVALVAGLERYQFRTEYLSPAWLSLIAGKIEIERVGSPIGYQDHIAAAYGGMLFTQYHPYYDELHQRQHTVTQLPDWPELFACCFLVKAPRRQISANTILKDGMDTQRIEQLAEMAELAKTYVEQRDLPAFGSLLHESWKQKKLAHSAITTPDIDMLYTQAKEAGALGGKLLGAGNGGYLLICAPSVDAKHEMQHTIFHNQVWYNVLPTNTGATIVYDDTKQNSGTLEPA